jgi:hypothetical protein
MNKVILQYLINDFMQGYHNHADLKYTSFVHKLVQLTKREPSKYKQIKLLHNILGPCTLVTYNLYFDIFHMLYRNDTKIINLLKQINDISVYIYL